MVISATKGKNTEIAPKISKPIRWKALEEHSDHTISFMIEMLVKIYIF
jgi:hypothetical protein